MTGHQSKPEQLQLCLHWPDSGFRIDVLRLASIDKREFDALKRFATGTTNNTPLLARALTGSPPYSLARDDISQARFECGAAIDYDNINAPEQTALMILDTFLSQAQDQSDAGISIQHWPNEHFEGQLYVAPGTNLLEDLVKINGEALDQPLRPALSHLHRVTCWDSLNSNVFPQLKKNETVPLIRACTHCDDRSLIETEFQRASHCYGPIHIAGGTTDCHARAPQYGDGSSLPKRMAYLVRKAHRYLSCSKRSVLVGSRSLESARRT